MRETTTGRPSAGAMAVARVLFGDPSGKVATTYGRKTLEGVADIIDRESGLAEAAAALRATGQAEATCDNPRDCGTAWGVCVPCTVRAALAKIEGRAERQADRAHHLAVRLQEMLPMLSDEDAIRVAATLVAEGRAEG